MTSTRRLLLPLVAALAVMAIPRGWAQQIAQSGHALDSNLRLGSGGFNGGVGGGGRRGHGGVRMSNQNPWLRQPYSVTRTSVDYRNSFAEEGRYNPNRSVAYRSQLASRSMATASSMPVETSGQRYAAGFDAGYEAASTADVDPSTLPPTAKQQMELISYGIGLYLGREIREGITRDQFETNDDMLVSGFRDGINKASPRIPDEEMTRILAAVKKRIAERTTERLLAMDPEFRRLHDENLAKSRAFHEKFGQRGGVTTLPSGVQYRVLVAGDGSSPPAGATVVVNYKVMETSGAVTFEGTGEEIDLDTTPEGVAEVLKLMGVGAKWLVAIPPELGHGAAGNPPEVGPNETLYGEIELVEIK